MSHLLESWHTKPHVLDKATTRCSRIGYINQLSILPRKVKNRHQVISRTQDKVKSVQWGHRVVENRLGHIAALDEVLEFLAQMEDVLRQDRKHHG